MEWSCLEMEEGRDGWVVRTAWAGSSNAATSLLLTTAVTPAAPLPLPACVAGASAHRNKEKEKRKGYCSGSPRWVPP